MAKKHRVKRATYVQHLLDEERKREEYLEKRQNRKRTRSELNEGHPIGDVADRAANPREEKRVRREAPEEDVTSGAKGHPATTTTTATSTSPAASTAAATPAPITVPAEIAGTGFFSGSVKNSTRLAVEDGARKAQAKKTAKQAKY